MAAWVAMEPCQTMSAGLPSLRAPVQVDTGQRIVSEHSLLRPGMTHAAGTQAEAAREGGAAAVRYHTTRVCTVPGPVHLDDCTGMIPSSTLLLVLSLIAQHTAIRAASPTMSACWRQTLSPACEGQPASRRTEALTTASTECGIQMSRMGATCCCVAGPSRPSRQDNQRRARAAARHCAGRICVPAL